MHRPNIRLCISASFLSAILSARSKIWSLCFGLGLGCVIHTCRRSFFGVIISRLMHRWPLQPCQRVWTHPEIYLAAKFEAEASCSVTLSHPEHDSLCISVRCFPNSECSTWWDVARVSKITLKFSVFRDGTSNIPLIRRASCSLVSSSLQLVSSLVYCFVRAILQA